MYDSYPTANGQAKEFSLDPKIEEMIAHGNNVRTLGGEAYVHALQSEKEADVHGTTADTPSFVGVTEPSTFNPIRSAAEPSQSLKTKIRRMNESEERHIERARRLRMGLPV